MTPIINYILISAIIFTLIMSGYSYIYYKTCVVEQSNTYYCK